MAGASFTNRSEAATPVTGSLNITVIASRAVTVPGGGSTLKIVGGTESNSALDSCRLITKSLLVIGRLNACTAKMLVPSRRNTDGFEIVAPVQANGSTAPAVATFE